MSNFKKYLNVYKFDVTLPGGLKLKIKPITTGQLKNMLIYEQEKSQSIIETALDELISGSVLTENFNIEDLYLQDRLFLLFELRKISRGSTYDFVFTCPKCKSQSKQLVDMDKFHVKKYNVTDNKIIIDENISLIIDFPTRADQKEAFEYYDKITDKEESINMVDIGWYSTSKSIKSIITPDGEDTDVSMEDKLFLLNELPQSGYEKIKDWYKNNNFGIDLIIKIKCKHKIKDKECGYSIKQKVRLNSIFL